VQKFLSMWIDVCTYDFISRNVFGVSALICLTIPAERYWTFWLR